ncbi:MAG: TM2 domain-containing protein [Defluviitaleaceae bacterium]|nr:TM2 domain-containing protein [Defluviitaleaceae bacterium]
MECSKHAGQQASGMCTYCGKVFCSECLVEIKGKMYCKEDVEKMLSEPQANEQNANQAQPQPQIIINNQNTNQNNQGGLQPPYKSKVVAAILCFFFGYLGVHRFYVGKTGTGLLYLFTGGLCGIGSIVDFVLILIGSFNDNWGRPLV